MWAAYIREKELITERHFFQYGYPKVWHLLQGSAYLRPQAYQRKDVNKINWNQRKVVVFPFGYVHLLC